MWILRSVAYRQGKTTEPDVELLESAGRLDLGYLEVLLCITEAAVAWRAGAYEVGRKAAARACERAPSAGARSPAFPLARALGAACGEQLPVTEVLDLAAAAMEGAVPRVGLQTLALLARVHRDIAPQWTAAAADLARRSHIEESSRHVRLEVLSLNETLDALGAKLFNQ